MTKADTNAARNVQAVEMRYGVNFPNSHTPEYQMTKKQKCKFTSKHFKA